MSARHQHQKPSHADLTLAGAVRAACVDAARDAYRDAAVSGLCAEGAQEAALGAIQMLDLESICRAVTSDRTIEKGTE